MYINDVRARHVVRRGQRGSWVDRGTVKCGVEWLERGKGERNSGVEQTYRTIFLSLASAGKTQRLPC